VGLFGRDKPLHQQLAEAAELDIGQKPRAPRAFSGFLHDLAADTVGIHGVSRPRVWDLVTTAEADLPGDVVHFTSLPDGTLVVEDDVPDGSLVSLAEAIELTIDPPYRAEGVRRSERVWGVAANRIQVKAYPGEEDDDLERVEDGQVILGRRLDGDLFEIVVSAL
jgi:hypothetical protein